MNIETIGLGAGSYPDAPVEKEFKTVRLECSFTTYVSVPEDLEDNDDIISYVNEMYSDYDLIEEADKIRIEDII